MQNHILAERLARTYVESWNTYNSAMLANILDPACILIEADGQIFRGARRIVHELDQRIAGVYGEWSIRRWDITALVVDDAICAFEWAFAGRGAMDGVSIMRFRDGRIVSMREYCTTGQLWEATGE
jgi:SnoaL-like protein